MTTATPSRAAPRKTSISVPIEQLIQELQQLQRQGHDRVFMHGANMVVSSVDTIDAAAVLKFVAVKECNIPGFRKR